jgi:WD40 repeat protein/tRNA A-37 threonylcarbamoyl transferase component Bud32
MTTRSLDNLSQLTPAQRADVEDRIEAFERAWQRGERPAIADNLPPDPEARKAVLVELVHIDLELRIKGGESARVESYLTQHPEFLADENLLSELLRAELYLRTDSGESPSTEEYVRRFPHVVEKLQSIFGVPRDSEAPAASQSTAHNRSGSPEAETLPPRTIETAAARSDTLLTKFGDYELLEEIARGGMGVVYKARQMSLNRIVAIKMILAGQFASESDVERFRTEAQAAANLQHPNIVAIHEVGQHYGHHYFSMNYVEGQSLAQIVRKGPLGPAKAAEYLKTIAQAIAYAHGQGTLHRDLKPANILIDRFDQPRVTDFGLAKRVEGTAQLTTTGSLMGTPSYMPPEQAGADGLKVGPASDVYSLGAVLYELMTGRPPFVGDTVVVTLNQVLNVEPVAPRQLNPKVPRDLETICLKCLEKEPSKRYATASALAEDLDRFLNHEPILARPVRAFEKAWRRCRRHAIVSSLVAAVILLIFVGSIISIALAARAKQQGERADFASIQMEAEKQRAAEREAEAGRLQIESQGERHRADHAAYVAGIASAQRELDSNHPTAALRHLQDSPPEFRSWEYDYLSAVASRGNAILVLPGQSGRVSSVAFSPDGKWIVAGGSDGIIKMFGSSTGLESLILKTCAGEVLSAAFSPDGKRFVSGNANATITVWDTATGRETLTVNGLQEEVKCLAFSPDGRRVVSGAGGMLRIWNAETGHLAVGFPPSSWDVNSVAFSPDGKRIVSGSQDKTLKVWDATSGQGIQTLKGHASPVTSVAFSPDGTWIVSGSEDKTVKIWDAVRGEELRTLVGHARPVRCVAVSPDGKRILSGSGDSRIKVWDPTNGQDMLTLQGHVARVNSLVFSRDGARIASGADDGTVRVWDAIKGQPTLTFEGHSAKVYAIAFSPHGNAIVSGSEDHSARLWDLKSGNESLRMTGHLASVSSVAFSPDGKWIVTGSEDRTLKLWDATNGQEVRTFKGHQRPIWGVAFSPDGKRIASASDDRTVKVWDTSTGQELLTLKGHKRGLGSVAFSPDGKRLASASDDHTIRIWDAVNGQEVRTLKGHEQSVQGVAFSPDGKRIVSGSKDRTIKVWDASSGQELFTSPVRTGMVRSVKFSPDGKWIVSGCEDGAIRIWDATHGDLVGTLRGHADDVWDVAFSPDERFISSASFDHTAKLWDVSSILLGASSKKGSSDKFVRSFMNGHDFEDEEVVVAKAVGLSLHGLDLVVSSFQRAC